jgi:biotin synthase
MNANAIVELKVKIKAGYLVDEATALSLSQTADKSTLYAAANEIREHFCGSHLDLCSITNAKSGRCSENCKWCSQSAWHHTKIEIYPLVEKTRAVDEAVNNAGRGVLRHSLVTSGKRVTDGELDELIGIFQAIRAKCSIELCGSMGLITRQQLQRLKDVGLTRYHCNLETAPSYFGQVCTTHTIEEKLETIRNAQAVGLEVCSGGIIGMGESMAQRIELALLLRSLGIRSIPINLLNPIAGTALQDAAPLSEDDVLTTIALFRFINPKAYLRFAGGRLLIRHYQDRALHAGINAAIVGDMLTTVGGGIADDLRDFSAAGFTFETSK